MPWVTIPKRSRRVSPKKIPETDAIFAQVNQINQAADAADDVLRISMDAKAMVKIGPFARAGKNRVQVYAADHDFAPEATVTPVGIFLPTLGELFVYGVLSKVTSDCLVDRLAQWWEAVRERFAHITTLVLNLDNGPENHSRRTQFMQRLVTFVQHYQLTVRLADYPPYHSKYNPIERCWGILENHWNGTLLDSIDTMLQFTRTMTWNGQHPVVELVTATYQTGVTLTKDMMETVEAQLTRLPALGKWFVDIVAPP
jgi:transposase